VLPDMADPRIVANNSIINESRLKRHTRGSKRVTTKNDPTTSQRLSPNMMVTFRTQEPHVASSSKIPSGGEKSYDESQSPIFKAAIYDVADLQDLPYTYTRRPRVCSWSSLRSSVQNDDGNVSSTTVIPRREVQLPSPMALLYDHPAAWRDSPVSGIDPTDLLAMDEARKNSDATIFPHFPSTIKKLGSKANSMQGRRSPRNLTDYYHTARAIYEVGPEGEGQKLWSSYKKTRKGKQDRIEVKQEPLKHVPVPRRPSAPGLSAHLPMRPPPPQAGIAPMETISSFKHVPVRVRNEFDHPPLACKVPVQIGPDIQQFVDVSKPLPPVPCLQPVPKAKQVHTELSKPLPSLPFRSIPRPTKCVNADLYKSFPPAPLLSGIKHGLQVENKSSKRRNLVSITTSGRRRPAQQQKDSLYAKSNLSKPSSNKPSPWWKFLTDVISERQIHDAPPVTNKHTGTTNPPISRPRPITALENGRTANVAIECGGVGGPGAAVAHPHVQMSEKQKGKQKACHEPAGNQIASYDVQEFGCEFCVPGRGRVRAGVVEADRAGAAVPGEEWWDGG
jgi:hypothetical protein